MKKLLAVLALVPLAAACRQDMQDQPKYKNLRGSALFEDHRSARPLPDDTVARGALPADPDAGVSLTVRATTAAIARIRSGS